MNDFTDPNPITELLRANSAGDASAGSRLLKAVYPKLRKRAAQYVRHERPDHTLQATALVHEAWVRLIKVDVAKLNNRGHFFALASRIMNRILKDYARARNAACHGGGARHINVDEAVVACDGDQDRKLNLNAALTRLKRLDDRLYYVVTLRFVEGRTESETAEALRVSVRTVKRDWRMAQAWLRVELEKTIR